MFFYQNNKEMLHSYLINMDETALDGVHNIEYSGMRATLFIAIRR